MLVVTKVCTKVDTNDIKTEDSKTTQPLQKSPLQKQLIVCSSYPLHPIETLKPSFKQNRWM